MKQWIKADEQKLLKFTGAHWARTENDVALIKRMLKLAQSELAATPDELRPPFVD